MVVWDLFDWVLILLFFVVVVKIFVYLFLDIEDVVKDLLLVFGNVDGESKVWLRVWFRLGLD